jgi:hypothetical protein
MDPHSEPLVEQEPSIHGLRQQVGDIFARWSDRLDPSHNPCDQPDVWLGNCHLNQAFRHRRPDAYDKRNCSEKLAEPPVMRAISLDQSDLLSK